MKESLVSKLRYENARRNFINVVREQGGDGTACAQVLEEYKHASDEYHKEYNKLLIRRR